MRGRRRGGGEGGRKRRIGLYRGRRRGRSRGGRKEEEDRPI